MTTKKDIDFSLIWRKVHDQLSTQEEQDLTNWLQEAKENQAYFEKISQQLQQHNPLHISQEATTQAFNLVEKQLRKPKTRQLFYHYWAAATISLLLISFVIFYSIQDTTDTITADNRIKPGSDKAVLIMSDGKQVILEEGKSLAVQDGAIGIQATGKQLIYQGDQAVTSAAENTIRIPRGGKYTLVLADGTTVWLNSETTLTYPVSFQDNKRKVTLQGEAYFDVAHDADKPFEVLTNEQKVTVLGTSFNIQAYQETQKIVTTLVEGKVAVQFDRHGVQETLTPNEQSEFSSSTRRLHKKTVDTDIYTGWKNGKFIFEDEALESLLNTLARWYDVQVFYKNDAQKRIRFTGEMERYETFETILKLIEKTNSVEFTIDGKTVIVN